MSSSSKPAKGSRAARHDQTSRRTPPSDQDHKRSSASSSRNLTLAPAEYLPLTVAQEDAAIEALARLLALAVNAPPDNRK
jgi:hypothetical protein